MIIDASSGIKMFCACTFTISHLFINLFTQPANTAWNAHLSPQPFTQFLTCRYQLTHIFSTKPSISPLLILL